MQQQLTDTGTFGTHGHPGQQDLLPKMTQQAMAEWGLKPSRWWMSRAPTQCTLLHRTWQGLGGCSWPPLPLLSPTLNSFNHVLIPTPNLPVSLFFLYHRYPCFFLPIAGWQRNHRLSQGAKAISTEERVMVFSLGKSPPDGADGVWRAAGSNAKGRRSSKD